MTSLRQRMLEDMQVRNLSPHTQRSYVQQVSRFARHFRKSPDLLGPEEIRNYQLFLTNDSKLAVASVLLAVAALRFLYTITLKKDWPIADIIPAPKKSLVRASVDQFAPRGSLPPGRLPHCRLFAIAVLPVPAGQFGCPSIDRLAMMAATAKGRFIDPMLLLRTDALPNDGSRWEYQLTHLRRAERFGGRRRRASRSRSDCDRRAGEPGWRAA
jgi:integrase-like protein